MSDEENGTYVIHHHPCHDGFCARWVAGLRFGSEAEYVGADYGDPLPEVPDGADVLMVDVSWPREVLEELRERVNSLVVLDHHKTARDDLEDFPGAVFDMERSGAMMAWNHLYPTMIAPRLVQYVQDRDLWRFEFGERTRDVHAYLSALPWDVDAWHEAARLLDEDAERVLSAGRRIRDYAEKLQESAASTAHYVVLPESPVKDGNDYRRFPVLAVNLQLKELVSETLHTLLEEYPHERVVAAYKRLPDGRWAWSLRSRAYYDASLIAKALGGGGHPQACGFVVDEPPIFAGRA